MLSKANSGDIRHHGGDMRRFDVYLPKPSTRYCPNSDRV